MKKVMIVALATLGVFFMNAQEEGMSGQTSQGNWLIEVNTGFGSVAAGLNAIGSTTGFGYTNGKSGDYKYSQFNGGAEAGYFIAENFAIKGGLGFSTFDYEDDTYDTNAFSFMLGSKYYISGMIPVQLDFRGSTIKDAEENPLWIGIQGGYAWFLNDRLALEPGLRYQHSLNDKAWDGGIFQFMIGFSAFFN